MKERTKKGTTPGGRQYTSTVKKTILGGEHQTTVVHHPFEGAHMKKTSMATGTKTVRKSRMGEVNNPSRPAGDVKKGPTKPVAIGKKRK